MNHWKKRFEEYEKEQSESLDDPFPLWIGEINPANACHTFCIAQIDSVERALEGSE